MGSARTTSTWGGVLGRVCARPTPVLHGGTAAYGAEKRYLATCSNHVQHIVRLQPKKEEGEKDWRAKSTGGRGKGEDEDAGVWGMLCADDAGIASPSPSGLEKLTTVMTACSAFGLTISKAKTEVLCHRQNMEGRCRSPSLQPAR